MTSSAIIDLSSLPLPAVVEQLRFEAILQRKLNTFLGLYELDTLLESDPSIKLLEASSYDELNLRQRINDAARARLLAFAEGEDLEHLGVYYGVFRLTGELDPALKARIRQAIMARSAAGTKAQYKFAALSTSVDVLDANVDTPQGGRVRISVLSRIGDGTPTEELLDAVREVCSSDSVYALCHTIEVVGAEIVTFNVTGNVWLTPTAPQAVFTGLPNLLEAEFAKVRALGYNIAPSWLSKTLQPGGVQRIELSQPASQITIAANQCAKIGTVNLTMAGRDY